MDVIREQLIYKNTTVHICMKDLKPIEHYEVVRLILASRNKNVFLCPHDNVNTYIDSIFKKLGIQEFQCLNQGGNLRFPPTVGASS
jgi:hypothetical protein